MKYVDNAHLYVIGAGAEWEVVKRMSEDEDLKDRISVLPKMPFEQLQQYTLNSDLGVSIDQPLHLNYKLSLPNKLFDYIQSGIPLLTSALPELMRVQEKYDIGLTIDNHDPKHIAEKLIEGLNSDKRDIWKENLKIAAEEYNWEKESEVIVKIYNDLL